MRMGADRLVLLIAGVMVLVLGQPCRAQGVIVQSVQSPAPALGTVSSAASGTTVFRIAADTGTVTRLSGTGTRIGGGSTHPLVTLACGSDTACATDDVTVTVTSLTASGRADRVGSFTVSGVSAVINSGPSGTDPITFTIDPIGQNATRTFHLGMDLPILGNESAESTGAASATFEVSAVFAGGGTPHTATGTASATVFRPLSVAAAANLSFGTVIRPASGSGTISIDAATGDVVLTDLVTIGPTGARARFTVAGEGGQSFSVSVPSSVDLVGSSETLVADLTSDAAGPLSLDGNLGVAGSADFHVGGQLSVPSSTPTGTYNGSFIVTVQYN